MNAVLPRASSPRFAASRCAAFHSGSHGVTGADIAGVKTASQRLTSFQLATEDIEPVCMPEEDVISREIEVNLRSAARVIRAVMAVVFASRENQVLELADTHGVADLEVTVRSLVRQIGHDDVRSLDKTMISLLRRPPWLCLSTRFGSKPQALRAGTMARSQTASNRGSPICMTMNASGITI